MRACAGDRGSNVTLKVDRVTLTSLFVDLRLYIQVFCFPFCGLNVVTQLVGRWCEVVVCVGCCAGSSSSLHLWWSPRVIEVAGTGTGRQG